MKTTKPSIKPRSLALDRFNNTGSTHRSAYVEAGTGSCVLTVDNFDGTCVVDVTTDPNVEIRAPLNTVRVQNYKLGAARRHRKDYNTDSAPPVFADTYIGALADIVDAFHRAAFRGLRERHDRDLLCDIAQRLEDAGFVMPKAMLERTS